MESRKQVASIISLAGVTDELEVILTPSRKLLDTFLVSKVSSFVRDTPHPLQALFCTHYLHYQTSLLYKCKEYMHITEFHSLPMLNRHMQQSDNDFCLKTCHPHASTTMYSPDKNYTLQFSCYLMDLTSNSLEIGLGPHINNAISPPCTSTLLNIYKNTHT